MHGQVSTSILADALGNKEPTEPRNGLRQQQNGRATTLRALTTPTTEHDAQASARIPGPARLIPRCSGSFGHIVGSSQALSEVLTQVETVAPTDATVLLLGETGTGKEVIARALHELSTRRGRPFVKLNCGAIPAGLLESELMGHEKGAFTGAIAQRVGRFELADGGTIFLDEIGELALELQPKILRVLQEREFERVGGSRTLRSDVRVIAATHRDLASMITDRAFREDLYYRLSVFPIHLPPLRERREDIPALAAFFLRQCEAKLGRRVESISQASFETLVAHDWPGNIRELQNVIERAVILNTHPPLEISLSRQAQRPEPTTCVDDLAQISRAHILSVLNATGWVIAGPLGAAARLGLKRSTLNFRMKKLGISRPASGKAWISRAS
jgi:formate hydrogenlyase transcriptional activator